MVRFLVLGATAMAISSPVRPLCRGLSAICGEIDSLFHRRPAIAANRVNLPESNRTAAVVRMFMA